MRTDAEERALLERVKTIGLSLGLRIADELLEVLGGEHRLTIHEYATTGGVTLVLPQDVLVNAPFDEPFCRKSPLELVGVAGGMALRLDGAEVPVLGLHPLPGYLGELAADGNRVEATTMSHADRIRVSPIDGCGYNCGFCNLPGSYTPHSLGQITAALDVALRDEVLPTRHMLISGGSPTKQPRQQDYFKDTCLGIVRHVRAATAGRAEPFSIDIMMSARPDGPEFVEELVAAGVDGFSLNVEVFSEEGARKHLPLKHKLARPYMEPMIAHAVDVLGRGSGRVRSLIIPGLETPEQTLEGIEWLASLGCHPVLSPFRSARDTKLEGSPPVSPEVLEHVLTESRRIVARHGVTLGPRCLECQHNTLSFPWDPQPHEVL
jgi:hypothetical protein